MVAVTWRTVPIYYGECERCGKLFQARNAMGLAAQHYARCGGRIRLEQTIVFVWDPDGPPEKRYTKENGQA